MVDTKRVCVVVLGDVGRSPRMQFHAVSLATEGFNVDLVGYAGSSCNEAVRSNERIKVHYMSDVPDFQKYFPRFVCYFLKVFWQAVVLFNLIVFSLVRPDYILVQNPPSIPLLPVTWFVSRCRGTPLVVDWHNYGFTILSMTLGTEHVLVKICRWCEGFFGAKADYHFCVTKALKADLKTRWDIDAQVLYDRPAESFQPIDLNEKHEILEKLSLRYPEFKKCESSRFTFVNNDLEVEELNDRPALVVSSTSWTEDEDFSILLEALRGYELRTKENSSLPKILCAITGKGPLKEHYTQLIEKENLENVSFVLPWLEPEEYPKLLAAADLGVCLHTSSSSLDLPMKVVDMFGCGLPVCAITYNCLSELVQHEANGLHFQDSLQLTDQLELLLSDLAHNKLLSQMRDTIIKQFSNSRWPENWRAHALSTFESEE